MLSYIYISIFLWCWFIMWWSRFLCDGSVFPFSILGGMYDDVREWWMMCMMCDVYAYRIYYDIWLMWMMRMIRVTWVYIRIVHIMNGIVNRQSSIVNQINTYFCAFLSEYTINIKIWIFWCESNFNRFISKLAVVDILVRVRFY